MFLKSSSASFSLKPSPETFRGHLADGCPSTQSGLEKVKERAGPGQVTQRF